MKAFLENFAAIVGAVTVAILAMSVSHEYGYFWSVGRQFQTFLTTTDYLANGVLWLPFAVFFVWFWGEWKQLPKAVLPSPVSPPATETAPEIVQVPAKGISVADGVSTGQFIKASARILVTLFLATSWKTWLWLTLYILILAGAISAYTWPLNAFSAVSLFGFVFLAWAKMWPTWTPPPDKVDEPFRLWIVQLVRVGPPILIGMFLVGSVDAGKDLTRLDSPYIFRLKNADHSDLRLFLRTFDRGVLVRNVSNDRVEFYKWEDVELISREAPAQSRTLMCWITGWTCDHVDVTEP